MTLPKSIPISKLLSIIFSLRFIVIIKGVEIVRFPALVVPSCKICIGASPLGGQIMAIPWIGEVWVYTYILEITWVSP
jgi:hypothetical protein